MNKFKIIILEIQKMISYHSRMKKNNKLHLEEYKYVMMA